MELPPLTDATIQRAKEGLAAARDRQARICAQTALEQVKIFAETGIKHRVSGSFRRLVLRTILHTFFKVTVDYPERIPTTSAMLAANHLSHFDPLLLLAEVPAHPYYYILGDARTLCNQWWKRQIQRLGVGTIPLDRVWKEEIAVIEGAKAGREDLIELAEGIAQDVPDGTSIESLRKLDRIVQGIFQRQGGLIIFPEGRLGKIEGELHLPLRRGAIIYALRAGIPIVPVVIIGTQDLYFRKQLTVRFGEHLIFPQSSRPKPKQIQTALDTLQAALIELLPKDYREPNEPKFFRYLLNHLLW